MSARRRCSNRQHLPSRERRRASRHLLAEGFSLKEIADHLGHASLSATQIYAKVDLTAIREVGQFDLHGLIAFLHFALIVEALRVV